MLTLFIVSSLEGWPDIMDRAMDSDIPENVRQASILIYNLSQGPSQNNSSNISYYFVGFIIVGSFFFLNLFVGVIFYHFNKAQTEESEGSNMFLTDEQRRWIQLQ